METSTTTSSVLAVLVAHDGERWLPRCLDALEAQTYEHLEILAVDNGSTDGSRSVLTERLGEHRVLVAERDLGFGAAVSMALDAAAAAEATYVLLVHDDLAIDPDGVDALVAYLEHDPLAAIAGCKLVDWDQPSRLQAVGMSIDATGRADSGIELDELDQGQRDQRHPALYVSTAGMLLRRTTFEQLGRFDRRYHLFRDDLDLCWRAWLAGHDVEVVPSAVGRHLASAANYGRLGQTRFLGPRYFAERNTLATLLKNYGTTRLLGVIPLYFLVGLAKILGFVATRRLSDAWQTLRAWAWNGLHLRETWRLRRAAQQARVRSDRELAHLFARVGTRARAYAEAIGDWVAGGEVMFDTRSPTDELAEPKTATARVIELVRRRPILVSASLLAILGLVVALPLLRPGVLRGGELAPWPTDPNAFLQTYVASWHDAGGMGTASAPSPAQAVLWLVGWIGLGSAWLAPRLLLLGAVPLAWILALRAGRLVTVRRLPRLAAATVYVLSPPLIAALRTGRIGALIVAVCLPALVLTIGTLVRADLPPARTWRHTAAASIVAAVAIAFEPTVLLGFVAVAIVGMAAIAGLDAPSDRRRGSALRLGAALLGAMVLLLPWSFELLSPAGPMFGSYSRLGSASQPFWRWLLQAPDLPGFPGVLAGIGLLAAGVLGLVLGFARRPVAVTASWTLALSGVFCAWVLGRSGADAWAWSGLPLLVTSLALAGLLAVAFSSAGAQLGAFDFGWRQVSSAATATVVVLGLTVSVLGIIRAPWDAYASTGGPVPAFVATETEATGPFRVLVLAEQAGVITWDLTGPEGPSMLRYGLNEPDVLVTRVGEVVEAVLGGSDPGAAARLGVAGIRYVVVPEQGRSEVLERALEDQLVLEPRPIAEGRLFLVDGWLPRAAALPREAALTVARRGEVPRDTQVTALPPTGDSRFAGTAPTSGVVLLAEPADAGWEATADGVALPIRVQDGLVRFDLDEPSDDVVVTHARQLHRTIAVTLQLLALLIAVSLMLRPPRFAQEERR